MDRETTPVDLGTNLNSSEDENRPESIVKESKHKSKKSKNVLDLLCASDVFERGDLVKIGPDSFSKKTSIALAKRMLYGMKQLAKEVK